MSLRIKSGNISNPNGSMYYECNTLFRCSQGRRSRAGGRGYKCNPWCCQQPDLLSDVYESHSWHKLHCYKKNNVAKCYFEISNSEIAQCCQNLGRHFSKKKYFKIKVSKKYGLELIFFNKKKIRRFGRFWHTKIDFQCPIFMIFDVIIPSQHWRYQKNILQHLISFVNMKLVSTVRHINVTK